MDYYDILGVSKSANDQELKTAFKKKAMQYHPDKGGDPEKFKQINEAYQNLSDPQKRQMYDQFGTTDPQQQQTFNAGNFSDVFEQVFGGGFGPFGFNARQQMRNQDITIGCNISIKEVYTGKNVIATYRLNNRREQTVDISVPKGVNNGDKIRFSGMGQHDIQQIPPGDLFVLIQINNQINWEVNGRDLLTTVKVSVLDLITGSSVSIDTPEGRTVKLNIPKGTQPNTVFNITGKGLPDRRSGGQGNIHVKVLGTVPKNIDDSALQQIEQIRRKI
jgi:curved DNA-binding protein|tara:strand:- start:1333 stop:2157 length:825 start_codon:yes stop_codon:yes gene_type:complete